jgi:hypothetical protein
VRGNCGQKRKAQAQLQPAKQNGATSSLPEPASTRAAMLISQ